MKNEQKTFNQTIDIAQLLPIFHPRLGVKLDITTQDNLISINWVKKIRACFFCKKSLS